MAGKVCCGQDTSERCGQDIFVTCVMSMENPNYTENHNKFTINSLK